MLLCVDLKAIRKDPEHVQKDVNLEGVIDTHTRLFPSKEEAIQANYAPLNFCISVRSMYSNTVIATVGLKKTLYYTNMTNIGAFPHKGEDLIMYLSSLGVLSLCDVSPELYEVMLKQSVCMPMGLVNIDPDFIDPMIYSHIILTDEGMTLFEKFLKPGNKVCPIQSINPKGNLKPLLDTLIIIDKEEDKDA